MFVAYGMWCLADVSSVGPSSEQTEVQPGGRDGVYCPQLTTGIWACSTIEGMVFRPSVLEKSILEYTWVCLTSLEKSILEYTWVCWEKSGKGLT